LKDLLDGIFKWEPKERISPQAVLEHPWFMLELKDRDYNALSYS